MPQFNKAPFELMLNRNRHVTLRRTVFKIFAVSWEK